MLHTHLTCLCSFPTQHTHVVVVVVVVVVFVFVFFSFFTFSHTHRTEEPPLISFPQNPPHFPRFSWAPLNGQITAKHTTHQSHRYHHHHCFPSQPTKTHRWVSSPSLLPPLNIINPPTPIMASVFLYHVVGDLTVGKPELVEFCETETIESAISAIGECTEGGIPVWKRRQHKGVVGNLVEDSESRQQRFVGIINSLDVVDFLSREECLKDQEKALKTPVSEVVVANNLLLKEVDPGTRLIDALEIMKQGVKRLLVPKSVGWKGMSKRFSIIYNGKWLKNINTSTGSNSLATSSSRPVIRENKFCCLSREDVVRFLIGCLGALAPLPLSSISSLGVVNFHYRYIEASSPALEVSHNLPQDPSAVAVIESTADFQHKIIGEISASKLWKCDYSAAAWALANLSAGQFVMGVEENTSPRGLPHFSSLGDKAGCDRGSLRPRRFSSRNIGFFSKLTSPSTGRSMYRGRSAPLTCKVTSSLAAVMAQMLSHRATHVWVTEVENEEILVGVVGYADIMAAVTRHPATLIP